MQRGRQCTYYVTLKRFRVTIVTVGKAVSVTYSGCVCFLRYAACNAHAPYRHLRSLRLYSIFPHCLINGTIKNKLLKMKCMF